MQEGLRQTAPNQSSKTSSLDEDLNQLLDDRRPVALGRRGVSRVSNIYGYLSTDDKIIDITSGEQISLEQLCERSDKAVVRIEVDQPDCYVSDLDVFDQIKIIKKDGGDINALIDNYWQTVHTAKSFSFSAIPRPEAMIVRDVSPSRITIIKR